MPLFDQAAFLPRAVGSLLAQDFPHWEAWILDDGSTDAALQVLPRLTGQDSRLHWTRWARNRGLGATLNTGLDRVRTPLVAYLPADDVWALGHLGALARTFGDP